jgi:hypothetical protein
MSNCYILQKCRRLPSFDRDTGHNTSTGSDGNVVGADSFNLEVNCHTLSITVFLTAGLIHLDQHHHLNIHVVGGNWLYYKKTARVDDPSHAD